MKVMKTQFDLRSIFFVLFFIEMNSVTVLAQQGKSEPQKPPNIILNMADDMGCECLGVNGCISYRHQIWINRQKKV